MMNAKNGTALPEGAMMGAGDFARWKALPYEGNMLGRRTAAYCVAMGLPTARVSRGGGTLYPVDALAAVAASLPERDKKSSGKAR